MTHVYKALMVARVLFPVLTCEGTRSHPHHRATIKALLTSTQPLSPLRTIRPAVSLPGFGWCLLPPIYRPLRHPSLRSHTYNNFIHPTLFLSL